MLFNTAPFFIFLIVVLAAFYFSPRPWRKYILLAASYWFYASWNPKFILLLLTLTVVDYTAAIWIESTPPGPRRRAALIFSLATNLGFLAFFKYFNFFAENLALASGRPANAFLMNIVLPLGISFHTFQSISYVVDVYRAEQQAVRNPIDYALFICFFPQLVAGPIVKARDFFRDLWHWNPPNADDVTRGIFMLALGLVKKMAFADQFAKVANTYFNNPGTDPDALAAWSGVLSFGLQIYFDFSGYTDMAIGIAKLLGFHFPPNFARPYLASSITAFWRRWHISLSTWLRDYLYVPLGGNRVSPSATYRNLLLTMLLGGLWHGASWNFIIWGGYHGTLLSLERILHSRQNLPVNRTLRESWYDPLFYLQALITFTLVLIGWVFFRASDLPASLNILSQLFSGFSGHLLLTPWHFGLIAAALLLSVLEETADAFEHLITAPLLVRGAALGALLLCLEIFGVIDAEIPFVYFQF